MRTPNMNRRNAIIGAIVALVIVCCFCGLIGKAVGGGTSSTDTTGAAVAQATSTPALPTATDTPAIPTATPSPEQVYQHLAEANCSAFAKDGTTPKATYDATSHAVSVTTEVGTPLDASAGRLEVRSIVFDCFKGFYTSSHASAVQDVTVTVNGPLVDNYGKDSVGLYGDAELSRQTASNFQWDNLDYDTAWNNNIYDNQYVLSN